jgi:hypothetical protein
MKKVIAVLIVLFVYMWFAFAGGEAKDSRFIAYNNGTVLDTQTNLMWAAKDNGKDINWEDAKEYCENYRGGGYTDWRMPAQDELAGLYNLRKSYSYKTKCGGEAHLTPLIELTCLYPWASETCAIEAAYVNFDSGYEDWGRQSYGGGSRALPVRSGK